MKSDCQKAPVLSIGVRAWNEEAVIRQSLQSVFQQSIFEELSKRGECCEVLCIPNGCADRTAEIAAQVFREQKRTHVFADSFVCRVDDVKEAGRNNTWNLFMHDFSHPQSKFLFLMDSDIMFNERATLFNMYRALLDDSRACVSTDQQIKDISFKKRKSWKDRLSLATSEMTGTLQGRFSGQIYCIRAELARRIYLPKDLGAPDDGFIKGVVCTNFFTEKLDPSRIVVAKNASHIYEAYTSPGDILKNQKRQMIGQATVHVLLEYVRQLPLEQRLDLARTLREIEEADPIWLRKQLDLHLQKARYFWRLFPGILTFRVKRWLKLTGKRRVTHLPAAVAGFLVTSIAGARAFRHLKSGQTHYWPKATREKIQDFA